MLFLKQTIQVSQQNHSETLHRLTRDISGRACVQESNLWSLDPALVLKNSEKNTQETAREAKGPAPEGSTQASGQRARHQCLARCPLAWQPARTHGAPEPQIRGPHSLSQRSCEDLISNTFKVLSTEPDVQKTLNKG